MSGLTQNGAKEFHRLFMLSTFGYVIVAIIAHFLVWQWRPWFPGPDGYAAVSGAMDTMVAVTTMLFG
ncbi:MAG: light-harvesting antenna LH1, beta subunit [Pseudomonadota bacterium]|mgnify:CR=1 FL=1